MTSARSEREPTTAKLRRRLAFAGIEQRVLQRTREAGPPRGSTVIVAFSGGKDSLCLAILLARLAPRLDLSVHLLHVDHGLRPSSAAEAEHARELALALELPIEVVRLDGDLTLRHQGAGIEEAARRERYLALKTHAETIGAETIATGHHLDDQAETVLLHLLRGAGLQGAAGMATLSDIRIPWWSDEPSNPVGLWRPLLEESPAAFGAYMQEFGLEPNHDVSNDEMTFRRNQIRHRVLPELDSVTPGARPALARFARSIAADARFVDEVADAAAGACIVDFDRLAIKPATALHDAILSRVLYRWLRSALPATAEVTANRVGALMRFLDSGAEDRRLEVGGGRVVTKLGSELLVGTPEAIEEALWSAFPGPRVVDGDVLPVPVERDFKVELTRFSVEIDLSDQNSTDTRDQDSFSIWLPRNQLRQRLELRSTKAGDCFIGGVGVSNWLRQCGVPVQLHRRVICLANDTGVLWVPGIRRPPTLQWETQPPLVIARWRPRT